MEEDPQNKDNKVKGEQWLPQFPRLTPSPELFV